MSAIGFASISYPHFSSSPGNSSLPLVRLLLYIYVSSGYIRAGIADNVDAFLSQGQGGFRLGRSTAYVVLGYR